MWVCLLGNQAEMGEGVNHANHSRLPRWVAVREGVEGQGGGESYYMPLFSRHGFRWDPGQVNCESALPPLEVPGFKRPYTHLKALLCLSSPSRPVLTQD